MLRTPWLNLRQDYLRRRWGLWEVELREGPPAEINNHGTAGSWTRKAFQLEEVRGGKEQTVRAHKNNARVKKIMKVPGAEMLHWKVRRGEGDSVRVPEKSAWRKPVPTSRPALISLVRLGPQAPTADLTWCLTMYMILPAKSRAGNSKEQHLECERAPWLHLKDSRFLFHTILTPS